MCLTYRTPSASSVFSSSSPVGTSPLVFWNQRNACCVCSPRAPSMGPGLNPAACKRSWAWRTRARRGEEGAEGAGPNDSRDTLRPEGGDEADVVPDEDARAAVLGGSGCK